MAYIKDYWDNKFTRARRALEHTEEMWNKYSREINYSIRNTIVYSPEFKYTGPRMDADTNIVVEALDSVSAARKYCAGKTAVLNFASYKEPGGRFIDGSKAQEECLCHESFLYNVLGHFRETFYAWNNEHKNRALYLNRALYSPAVVFTGDLVCDVITCAAPNKDAAQKYQNVTDLENYRVLKDRIDFVLAIAADQCVNTIILGAYGCGVFGQDPYEVASIFKQLLRDKYTCFDNVIFGIPAGKDNNLPVFQEVFNK